MIDVNEHAIVLGSQAFQLLSLGVFSFCASRLRSFEHRVTHFDACVRDRDEIAEVQAIRSQVTSKSLRLALHRLPNAASTHVSSERLPQCDDIACCDDTLSVRSVSQSSHGG